MVELVIIFIEFGLVVAILISCISNIFIGIGYFRANKFIYEIGKKIIFSSLFLFCISLFIFMTFK